ncbi:hypothetical protein QN277_019262 [Acacia crassicarpa]|uniref:J domain-containing protein n=1 Tax=Acacia crassicarpa TaxID=499986 RepID=A0AAE1JYA9_9FABA|nr:hypothetical protein QN277_019262 [Acacia crassicarpa]
MSPALVVPRVPVDIDNFAVWASHPISTKLFRFSPISPFERHQEFPRHMEKTNAMDRTSGISKPNVQKTNFSTPSASSSRPVSGLSRPRLVKVRKQNNAQSLRSTTGIEEHLVAPGFNPFASVGENLVRPSPGSEMASSSTFSEIDSGQAGNEPFVFGAKSVDPGSNLNKNHMGSDVNFDQGIVDQMRNLKMGNVNDASNFKDGGYKKGEYAFQSGHKKSSSHDGSLVFTLPEDMKKLNIGVGGVVEHIDKTKSRCSNTYTDGFSKFTSRSISNPSVSSSVEMELQSELNKKLSIKESSSGGLHIDNSTNELLNQMKNLNVKDSMGFDSVKKNEADVTTGREKNSASANSKTATSYTGGRAEASLLREMEKLKLFSEKGDVTGPKFWNPSSQVPVGETNQTNARGGRVDKTKEGIRMTQNATLSSSFLSGGVNFPMVGNASGVTKRDEFVFTGKKDDSNSSGVEFKTPGLVKGQNSNTRVKKRRGKLKLSAPGQLFHGQDFVSTENVTEGNPEASEAYSPMEVSPYQESLAETRCSRENSVTSNDSLSLDTNSTATDVVQTTSDHRIDEDLIVKTERLLIDECDAACKETKDKASECHIPQNIFSEDPQDGSASGVETESFKSVNDEVDIISDAGNVSVEAVSSPSSSVEASGVVSMPHLSCASSSNDISGFPFTFSASYLAEAQSSSPKRNLKKKNWLKAGYDAHSSTPSLKICYSSSSMSFSSCSQTSSLFTSGQTQKDKVSTPQPKTRDSEIKKEQGIKKEAPSNAAAVVDCQEAIEKWRHRGNQAYKNGDLSMAEDCYTKGLQCISKEATSRSSMRVLMLCYSNRAATRMSLGRMRDALKDCILAAEIDPNFLRVQLRAANCYLALGEVEDSLQYFKRCLQTGAGVCVDRKIAVEASDGLQKAQKVLEFINHSVELLQRRMTSDTDSALEQIKEALMISSYSEKLLEMKAEALFMLCKFEEVIQLCEQTLGSAEKNFCSLDADGEVMNLDDSKLPKSFYFRLWRCSMKLKSYFHLGKLEEGLSSLEEQEKAVSSMNKSNVFESLIPLAAIVRKLLRHKTAGNEAFQAGRHAEAVEHYTAALSCNVESRPFAAVCFCNRAAAHTALGQITDAIADCCLAIALDVNYLKALSRRATLYEKIRDYAQAACDLRRLVSILNERVNDKDNQHGISDRSYNYVNDLKQNSIRLSEMEEEARKDVPLDMYLILGVEPSISTSDIKKAYRKAALRHHPDKASQSLARSDNGDDQMWKDIAEEVRRDADRLFKMIGEAYAVLSDPAKRARYDADEEMRNAQKKRNEGSMARTNVDTQSTPFEPSNMRRHWRDLRRSYANSSSRGFETGQSGRSYGSSSFRGFES